MTNKAVKIVVAGLVAGVVSQSVLGVLFISPPVQKVLYNPEWQSRVFIEVTQTREMLPSVIGLIVLCIIHAWLFSVLQPGIPGKSWKARGMFWGITIWLMYWVFQEWFIYHTLLREPLLLASLELIILLTGSIVEGLIISRLLFLGRTKD